MGMQSTGHAGGIHNWLVKPNLTGGLTALLRQMGTGLLVTDVMGQGVNIVTGDYSRGAAVSGWKMARSNIRLPKLPLQVNYKIC